MNSFLTFSLIIIFVSLWQPSSTQLNVVVFDGGSYFMKAGLPGSDVPKIVMQNVVSYNEDGNVLIGSVAKLLRNVYEMLFPVNFGYLTDPYGIIEIWKDLYKNLEIEPEKSSVVITKSPVTSGETREMASRALTTLGVPEVTFVDTAVMTLKFAQGPQTGIVIESGHHMTFVVPIIDGVPIDVATQRLILGGTDVTLWMCLLIGHHFDVIKTNKVEDGTNIAKFRTYVALDFENEPETNETILLDFIPVPKYDPVPLGKALFTAPELMFKPYLNNLPGPGIVEAVYNAIQEIDPKYHAELYGNIVLGGGNTLFPGIAERIEKDLREVTSNKVKVVAKENREYSAWIGASMTV